MQTDYENNPAININNFIDLVEIVCSFMIVISLDLQVLSMYQVTCTLISVHLPTILSRLS